MPKSVQLVVTSQRQPYSRILPVGYGPPGATRDNSIVPLRYHAVDMLHNFTYTHLDRRRCVRSNPPGYGDASYVKWLNSTCWGWLDFLKKIVLMPTYGFLCPSKFGWGRNIERVDVARHLWKPTEKERQWHRAQRDALSQNLSHKIKLQISVLLSECKC